MNIETYELEDIDGDNKKTIDFDNILEQRIKIGKTQLMVFICSAILWLADGAEMLVIGFILPVIAKEWELSDYEINWIGSIVFLSWAIGAIYVGKLSDKIGRRKPMIAGALGQFITAVLSAFSPNYYFLLLARGGFGFCLGLTAPISVTNFSETFPKKNRGRYFVMASSFFVIGELLTVLMAYFCLDSITTGNWRLLLLWSSFPGAIALLLIFSQMKESPRYLLLCTDKYEKAFSIINKMIKKNHKKNNLYKALLIKEYEKEKVLKWVEQSKLNNTNENNKVKSGYKELFKPQYKETTIKLLLMWFSLSVVYYGIMYILPTTLIKMHGSEQYEIEMTGENGEQKKQDDFKGIALTTLIEIPSALLVMALIENKKIGRKNFMTIAYGASALFCFIVFFLNKPNATFFFFVSGAKVCIGFCFAVIYPFTAEIYSTSVRAAGCGLNNSVCRMGGVIMPWLSFLFFIIANTGPFLIFSVISCVSFIASYKLKGDTTNLELDKFVDIPKPKSKNDNQKQQQQNDDDDDAISVISKGYNIKNNLKQQQQPLQNVQQQIDNELMQKSNIDQIYDDQQNEINFNNNQSPKQNTDSKQQNQLFQNNKQSQDNFIIDKNQDTQIQQNAIKVENTTNNPNSYNNNNIQQKYDQEQKDIQYIDEIQYQIDDESDENNNDDNNNNLEDQHNKNIENQVQQ